MSEYGNNGDSSKTLSVEEYLNKIRLYLKDIINKLKKNLPRGIFSFQFRNSN